MKPFLFAAGLLCYSLAAIGQSTGDVLKQQAGQGVREGATIATEQTANNVSNKLINKLFTKKPKTSKADSAKAVASLQSGTAAPAGATSTAASTASSTPATSSAELKTYGKFDFVPGDKILVVEDFAQDAIGDFPDKWNTNSTGEIQTIEGRDGKWFSVTKKGVFLPEFITSLPDNFTLQFDLVCSEKNTAYSGNFGLGFYAIPDPAKQFASLGFGTNRNGVNLGFSPGGGSSHGLADVALYSDNTQTMNNEVEQTDWVARDPAKRVVKLSIWRQRQRLRVYMNEEKVWDMPRAFETGKNYNSVLFILHDGTVAGDRYLFSNLRLAVGAPDTRNKLMTEGRFSTTGILFDVNSAVLKPESYGSLKDIADVLKENAAVRVSIVGHTDSDGDAAQNLALSQKRAAAVRDALVTTFGIDAARLQTDGKGSTQPMAPNTTAAGKAQNRRVEFIKL
ncbi:MAG TPA: OmpA family protein [Puia sp.]|jgi:OOP family OmpA-OmpF porin|nr:OmpA family protein [Puia sp.]